MDLLTLLEILERYFGIWPLFWVEVSIVIVYIVNRGIREYRRENYLHVRKSSSGKRFARVHSIVEPFTTGPAMFVEARKEGLIVPLTCKNGINCSVCQGFFYDIRDRVETIENIEIFQVEGSKIKYLSFYYGKPTGVQTLRRAFEKATLLYLHPI